MVPLRKGCHRSSYRFRTKDFNKGANVTVENLLNGRVAGVTINTSAPGSGSQIRIRGGSSFASNDPIVIDGLPIENNDKNFGSTSILASLNPSTIESMTVLKMLLQPQFTVRVRLMVLLSSLQKREENTCSRL
jgi:outer membrane receptor protein involved in Fe transport